MNSILSVILDLEKNHLIDAIIPILTVITLYLLYINYTILKLLKDYANSLQQQLLIEQSIQKINSNMYVLLQNQEIENAVLNDIKSYLEIIFNSNVHTKTNIAKFKEE